MKRSLILAAAATLASSGAFAQSSMSLYGLIDMCYGRSIPDGAAEPKVKADLHSGGDEGSGVCNSTTRFGLKGSADVGDGVKANFRLESGGITSDGDVNPGGNFFNRQAWMGLSGSWGEFRIGRTDSIVFTTMIDFDFNGASNGVSAGAYTGVGPFANSPGRFSRQIQYISPSFGGITFKAGLRPKGNSEFGNKDAFAGSVAYADGPIAAAVAFQSKLDSAAKDFYSLAGSYDFGVAKVMASYADGGKIGEGGTGKGYQLGVTAPVAGINIGAIYAHNSDSAVKAKAWELFVNKEIFKNVIAYAEAGNLKATTTSDDGEGGVITNNVKGNGYAVGLIYVF